MRLGDVEAALAEAAGAAEARRIEEADLELRPLGRPGMREFDVETHDPGRHVEEVFLVRMTKFQQFC